MVKALLRALSILLIGVLSGVPVIGVKPVTASRDENMPESIPGQPIAYLAGHEADGTEALRVGAPARDSSLLRASAAISVNYLIRR